jgi:hypothetical protein
MHQQPLQSGASRAGASLVRFGKGPLGKIVAYLVLASAVGIFLWLAGGLDSTPIKVSGDGPDYESERDKDRPGAKPRIEIEIPRVRVVP